MAEMIIGPKGEMAWDKDRKAQVLAATGSWVHRERARNAALAWIDGHYEDSIKPPVHRLGGGMAHNTGLIIGVSGSRVAGQRKPPIFHELRIDVDEDKGPHYNAKICAPEETYKACFRFDAPPGVEPKEWIAKTWAKWSR
jgi:hypothetical protein